MSPHGINSLVGDLVEMAKATERLPQLETELHTAQRLADHLQETVQERELAIQRYKTEIEELNAKVRSLEVERDDASFRVLEAEDREHNVLAMAKAARVSLDQITKLLDPPKPEPVKEPEPSKFDDGGPYNEPPILEAVHSVEEVPQGQSESSPTATTTQDEKIGSAQSTATEEAPATSSTADPGLALGPYFGKRYVDVAGGYVSYHDWISGGGTNKDYFER